MLEALVINSDRKYFITEVVFFKDWYDYLTEEKKGKVHQLVDSGQL